jgi:hypothetical protein
MSPEDEHALYLQLRELPDFECFPLPQHWYPRYNIEQPGLVNPREYMESNYAIKKQFEKKNLPAITKGPLLNPDGTIRLLPFLPPQEIAVETRFQPYIQEGDMTPTILPSLREPTETEVALPQTSDLSQTDTHCMEPT